VSEAIAERKPLPTGTVTFLFSDIEGSTERWERFREFCAAFNTVPNAIAAAVDAQRARANRAAKLRPAPGHPS
jgi:class 3 adenylate cyclase